MKAFGRLTFGSVALALVSLFLLGGCTLVPHVNALLPGNRAFIVYWPAKLGTKQLKLAIKDNIDMAGVVTTAGSEYFAKTRPAAKKDAPCLALARQRNVHIVGKANMAEFAVTPSGCNDYFGTPRNPFNLLRGLIPGGSSSGSAVAVASGMADVAFGTDTAGSIRVPAACCGIVGLKTTYGLVSIEGVYPLEPEHLDTVGPMAKNIARTAEGMDLLQNGFASKYAAAQAAEPFAQNIRVGRLTLKGTDPKIDAAINHALTKTGFQIVPLDDDFRQKWEQAERDGNAIAAGGVWITDKNYRNESGVSVRTKAAILAGSISYKLRYREALARQAEWQNTLRKVFKEVDFIALPTMQTMPLAIPKVLKVRVLEVRMLLLQNTVPVNFAGNPALAMPVPLDLSILELPYATVPVTSLQLIGPPRSEAQLLNAGRLVEAAVRESTLLLIGENTLRRIGTLPADILKTLTRQ